MLQLFHFLLQELLQFQLQQLLLQQQGLQQHSISFCLCSSNSNRFTYFFLFCFELLFYQQLELLVKPSFF
jgi:hypothetical protein